METVRQEASRESSDYTVFDRLAEARRSCRAFLPDPLPEEMIGRVLRTAQRTPSWNNAQPWQLIITRGKGTERFRRMMQAKAVSSDASRRDFAFPREYAGEYLTRRRACGFQLYAAVGIQRGDKEGYARQTMRNFSFFDAPHVAIVTSEEALGVYGAVDCGGYVSHFMVAAQSLGIGTIAQGALAEYAADIREHFNLPDNRRVVCGISFGWPDHSHPANSFATERATLSEVVTWVSS
ncbi:nitroreductase [Mesorhizobium sp. 1B3]|uniref:nitroreductase n=1 Tax=Mesorhizobium sp. 1B3 TaxID=3243599 RepID=UPI003D996594